MTPEMKRILTDIGMTTKLVVNAFKPEKVNKNIVAKIETTNNIIPNTAVILASSNNNPKFCDEILLYGFI